VFSRLLRFFTASLLVLSVAALPLSGCSENAESRPQSGQSNQQQAPDRAGKKREHLVETAIVKRDSLRLTSVYTGSLRSRRTVRIFNQEEGRVTKLPFFEGDRVEQGQLVLELDDALLRAEYAKASSLRREAESNLERVRQLKQKRVVSEDEYLRAVTAVEVAKGDELMLKTRLGYTRVQAPFTGVVAERLVEPGDVVPRHSHVLTVINPTALVADLQVSELLLPHLEVGDAVAVRIDALGDAEFEARVLRIYPEVESRTRQGRVEVELTTVPEGARAGQFARVTFRVEASERKVLPFSALRRDHEGEFVFRIADGNRVERVPVRSGRRLADRVEILEGLEPEARVVTKGFLGLSEGMEVKPLDPNPAAGTPG
jgi:membrane fusion protein (multidrug efflux system)